VGGARAYSSITEVHAYGNDVIEMGGIWYEKSVLYCESVMEKSVLCVTAVLAGFILSKTGRWHGACPCSNFTVSLR